MGGYQALSLEAAGRPQLGCHGAELDDTQVVQHLPLTDDKRIAHISGVAIVRRIRPEVGVVELGVIRHQRGGAEAAAAGANFRAEAMYWS